MKKAIAVLGVAGTLALAAAPPAHAGSSTDAALALGAFAVFNQFVTGQTVFQRAYPPQPVYVQPAPPVYYAPPPPTVIYAPPPPVVYYTPPPVAYYPSYAYPAPQPYYPSYAYPAPRPYYPRYWRHHRRHDDDD